MLETLNLLVDRPAWMADALCCEVDTDLFFPERGQSPADAKRVCARCPVQAECLKYALTHDERFGVWGGTSERDRRRMRAKRRWRAAGRTSARAIPTSGRNWEVAQ